jgi:hypothetical protein
LEAKMICFPALGFFLFSILCIDLNRLANNMDESIPVLG